MRVTVRVELTQWAAGDLLLPAGEHELDVNKHQAELLGAAVAAGAVVLVDADAAATKAIAGAVEDDAASEKKLEKAMLDGAWHEGNLAQYELEHPEED
jgi:hypothetical protein